MTFLKKTLRGEITIITAIISAVGLIAATSIGSYFSFTASANTRVTEVKESVISLEGKVNVNKNTEELHYTEIKESLFRIEKKLDTLK